MRRDNPAKRIEVADGTYLRPHNFSESPILRAVLSRPDGVASLVTRSSACSSVHDGVASRTQKQDESS